jgi:predicted amidohydrolase YtcJ
VDLYKSLLDSNALTVRLRLSHTFSTGGQWRTTESVLDEILKHPLCQPNPMLQIIGTKIWLDGGMLTGSALMQEPWGVSSIYGITDKEYRGVQRTPSENLVKMVKKVADAGLQFTAHSVGDGAVKLLLDVYEAVDKEKPIAASRPCLTHSNFMTPESVAKAGRLGVVVDMQPIWFYLDGATLLKQFGNERMSRFQPLRSLFDAKVAVGGGSDHMQKIGSLRSINPYNPWLGMWIAIARKSRCSSRLGMRRRMRLGSDTQRAQRACSAAQRHNGEREGPPRGDVRRGSGCDLRPRGFEGGRRQLRVEDEEHGQPARRLRRAEVRPRKPDADVNACAAAIARCACGRRRDCAGVQHAACERGEERSGDRRRAADAARRDDCEAGRHTGG